MFKVLIIEDNEDIVELVKTILALGEFDVLSSPNGKSGIALVKKENPNLIVLDLILPDIDGLDVCKRLKEDPETKEIPILMLTSRTDVVDRVRGLETGADDYLSKPFDNMELLARIKVFMRRSDSNFSETREKIKTGSHAIDPSNYSVTIDGKPVLNLTPREFDILYVLMKHTPKPVNREDMYQLVWGKSDKNFTRVIDIHIAKIRKKIGAARIKTIPAKGYFFAQT